MPQNNDWVPVPANQGEDDWQPVPQQQAMPSKRLAQRIRPGESIYPRDPRVPQQDIRGAAPYAPIAGAAVGGAAGSMVGMPNVGMGAGEGAGVLLKDAIQGQPMEYKKAAAEGLMTAGGGKLLGEGVGALTDEGVAPLAKRIASSPTTGKVLKGVGTAGGYALARWPGMVIGREAGGALGSLLKRMGGAEGEAAGAATALPSTLSERVSSSESPVFDAGLPKGTSTRVREGGKFTSGETTTTGTPKTRGPAPGVKARAGRKATLAQKIAQSPIDDIAGAVSSRRERK